MNAGLPSPRGRVRVRVRIRVRLAGSHRPPAPPRPSRIRCAAEVAGSPPSAAKGVSQPTRARRGEAADSSRRRRGAAAAAAGRDVAGQRPSVGSAGYRVSVRVSVRFRVRLRFIA